MKNTTSLERSYGQSLLSLRDLSARPGAASALMKQVRSLLQDSGLPTEGLEQAQDQLFVMLDAAGQLLACAALEIHANQAGERAALLRSVAVREQARGQGLGTAIAQKILAHAAQLGFGEVYLLTTTALAYWQRFGFVAMDRAMAPQVLQASVEFTGACPASAAFMRKKL